MLQGGLRGDVARRLHTVARRLAYTLHPMYSQPKGGPNRKQMTKKMDARYGVVKTKAPFKGVVEKGVNSFTRAYFVLRVFRVCARVGYKCDACGYWGGCNRHHMFTKPRGDKSVELSEAGPRFELRLYQLRLGTMDSTTVRISHPPLIQCPHIPASIPTRATFGSLPPPKKCGLCS